MNRRGHGHVFAYVDDFRVIGDSRQECETVLEVLLSLLRELGFIHSMDKSCVTFYQSGIFGDTDRQ